jgi:hypothetical protein
MHDGKLEPISKSYVSRAMLYELGSDDREVGVAPQRQGTPLNISIVGRATTLSIVRARIR